MDNTIQIFQDGNQVGVILGTLQTTNIQESPCGFGDTLSAALRELALSIEESKMPKETE